MTKLERGLCVCLCLSVLSACDDGAARRARGERESSAYQSAMADYHAGRLAQAAKGFASVVSEEPENGNARFQYACLLQDSQHDYVGAYCAFREFLLQNPDGEKAKLARDRLALCEVEAAKTLAQKHGLLDQDALAKKVELAQKDLEDARRQSAKLQRDLETAQAKIAALADERSRLVALMKTDGDKDAAKDDRPKLKDVRALLDEDDEDAGDRITSSKDAAALRIRDDEAVLDRKALADDIAALRDEEADELRPSPVLPSGGATNGATVAAAQQKDDTDAKREPPHETRPKTYVVQDGDTLYKIAIRFYGRTSAWAKIRDANKTVISTDGRVKAGDVIVLP